MSPKKRTVTCVVDLVAGTHAGGFLEFQLERRSCGKARCKRCLGYLPAHGPYWYAYWQGKRGRRSLYIGKSLSGKEANARLHKKLPTARLPKGAAGMARRAEARQAREE